MGRRKHNKTKQAKTSSCFALKTSNNLETRKKNMKKKKSSIKVRACFLLNCHPYPMVPLSSCCIVRPYWHDKVMFFRPNTTILDYIPKASS